MENLQVEIMIRNHICMDWAVWFEGLELEKVDDVFTRIHGEIPDQPALHGLLERIRDLNLFLVSVRVTSVLLKEEE